MFAWICLSFAFGLFVMAVTPTSADHLVALARAFIASYLIGYLALVAPGGLGVREGAITFLLTPMVGPGPAAGLALLSRLWITATELMALIPAIWWGRRDRAILGPVDSRAD